MRVLLVEDSLIIAPERHDAQEAGSDGRRPGIEWWSHRHRFGLVPS